jgi:Cu-Zn family superoxide dismutase
MPGTHSFYIHQVANCSSPNAASAGPVWALKDAPAGQKPIGELPELVAGTEGNADVMMSVRGLSVGDGAPTDVIGHSVVVHDGLVKNPRPEFGVPNGWLACGVIERK